MGGYDDAGELVFNGEDRDYLDGYEYSITVAPDQFDKLRAHSGPTGCDVVDLVCAHVDRSWRAASGAG